MGDFMEIRSRVNFLSNAILILLLLLRFLSGWLTVLFDIDLFLIVDVNAFLSLSLIFAFIWLNRDNLAAYHFDRLSILIILSFISIRVLLLPLIAANLNSPAVFPHPLFWMTLLLSLVMCLVLIPTLKTLPPPTRKSWGWLMIGAMCGIGANLLFGFLLSPFAPSQNVLVAPDYSVFLAFFYQIGYAGAYEEPLFRGILWGKASQSLRLDAFWVNILQTILFTLAHGKVVLQLLSPPSFIAIFLGGLLFGFLAHRSRSVSASMIAHGFYNAFGFFSTLILQSLKL